MLTEQNKPSTGGQNNDGQIFDSELEQSFRRRALRKALSPNQNSVASPDFLLAHAAEDLSGRLAVICRRFHHAADIFSHTDLAAQALRASGKAEFVERVESLTELARQSCFPCQTATAETLLLPQGRADLITSLLGLQMVNDIPGLFLRLRRALRPDGLFLAVLCGAGTLGELRASLYQAESELYGGITPHIAPFIDVQTAGALLQRAGFAMPVADAENITVRYESLFALMHDLRSFGAQNALTARRRRPYSRRFFLRAAEIYAERFADADGRIKATFSFLWLSGWAPHESQQKPARRGSAQTSLAEALKL